jgi:hypothetical protein
VVNRGHLLARQLGGSGTDLRNLVTIYRAVNDPDMKSYETRVAALLAVGPVYYEAHANYSGNSALPSSIDLYWQSETTGVTGTVNIPNVP